MIDGSTLVEESPPTATVGAGFDTDPFEDSPLRLEGVVGRFHLTPESDPAIDVALRPQASVLIDAMATFSASTDAQFDVLPTHAFHALPIAVSSLAA